MRRIGRWMLSALTALSLLLCVGTCVLWVRGYSRYERVAKRGAPSEIIVGSHPGCVMVTYTYYEYPASWEWYSEASPQPVEYYVPKRTVGFGYDKWSSGTRLWQYTLVVPCWFLFLLTVLLPAVACYRWWPRRRAGFCRRCSYDLTGNVSGVCPECGRKIAEAK